MRNGAMEEPGSDFAVLDPWGELGERDRRREECRRIFDRFITTTTPVVRSLHFKNIPAESDRFAVIVEPRPHPLLEYVLRNTMHFLGAGWGLQIFTGRSNRAHMDRILNNWETVYVHYLDVDNLEREEFRRLRKSPEFWSQMRGEHLLCFETDSILCRRGVDEFLPYDYVGAPWSEQQAVNPAVRVGNGGLSLRRKSVMIEICRTCKPWVIPSEDSYFSINLHLRKAEFRLPDVETAQRFSVESLYYPRPFGMHKPWGYLTPAQLETILAGIRYT